MIWHSACNNVVPEEPSKGWELIENWYQIVWFTSSQMPDSVIPDTTEADDDKEENDATYQESTSEFEENDIDNVCEGTDTDDWD